MRHINIETYTLEEAALYWGEPNAPRLLGARYKTPQEKNIQKLYPSVDITKTIELELKVRNQTYSKIEFIKNYYFSGLIELFRFLKKYEVFGPDATISYNSFREKFKNSPDEHNYMYYSFEIPLSIYNKHTFKDLEKQKKQPLINLPRGI